jgi:hypothetical protein
MKNKKSGIKKIQEIRSLNDGVYDMFSVEELEKRLQMSVLESWPRCSCHGTNAPSCTSLGEQEL